VLFQAKFLKCSDFDEMCDLALTLIPFEVAIREKLEKQAMVVLYKRLKAAINYKYSHNKIQSRAYLFKAKYAIAPSEEEDYQLTKVCEHSVQVVTVDGDHVTILSQPELVQGINKIVS
jgi:fatty acid synthase